MADNQACCACSTVMYAPVSNGDGTMSEHWECPSCKTVFVKRFWLEQLRKENDAQLASLRGRVEKAEKIADEAISHIEGCCDSDVGRRCRAELDALKKDYDGEKGEPRQQAGAP